MVTMPSPYTQSFTGVLVGALISEFLFGMITQQAWMYVRENRQDKLWIKVVVRVLWVLALGNTICINFATSYTVNAAVQNVEKGPSVTIFIAQTLAALIVLIVQLSYITCLRLLTSTVTIPLLLSFLSVAAFALALAGAVSGFVNSFSPAMADVTEAAIVTSAAVDILVTVALCAWLHRQRKGLAAKTKGVIDKLMMWFIETGLTTTAACVGCGVGFLIMHDHITLSLYYASSGMYICSLFCTFNGRRALGELLHGQMTTLDSAVMAEVAKDTESDMPSMIFNNFEGTDNIFATTRAKTESVHTSRSCDISQIDYESNVTLPRP